MQGYGGRTTLVRWHDKIEEGTASRTPLVRWHDKIEEGTEAAPLQLRRKGLEKVAKVWVLQHTPCETWGAMEDLLRAP